MARVSVVISVYDEDDFNKSLESIRNQTVDDVEIICIDKENILGNPGSVTVKDHFNVDDISGDYVYFSNSGDLIESDAFEKCLGICEEKSLDFIQFDSEDKFDDEIYSLSELKGRAFQLDMARNARFYRTSFIRSLKEISDIDYLFFWECLFNAKKFSFISLNFNPKELNVDYQKEIDDSNKVFVKFHEYELAGKYLFILFDWRIELLYDTYLKLDDELKQSCFEAYREDFTKMIYHWRFTDFSRSCEPINKLFFNDIVYSKDFDEFKKLMVQYEIELDTLEVERQQEIIEKNIQILKNENYLILNSTSWKITEPLRKIK